jgi:hypothetical protein
VGKLKDGTFIDIGLLAGALTTTARRRLAWELLHRMPTTTATRTS